MLPGLIPRVSELFSSGFSYVASLIAVIYGNSGLLPAGHPYLKYDNFGRFGIRHVIAEASNNLVLDRKHLDQLVIHLIIISGMVMLVIQVCLALLSVVSFSVFALPPPGTEPWPPYGALFGTPFDWNTIFINPHPRYGPDQDLAFIVLDRVFGIMDFNGVGGFFGSCYSTAVVCEDMNEFPAADSVAFPEPFHRALHQFFGFYTLGIAFLSLIVIIYFIVAIVGESIVTGRPFGQRFNKGWFIPRLIAFFALIAPMNMGPGGNNVGINAAQYITLGAAYFGSNMATNAWNGVFVPVALNNDSFVNSLSGSRTETLIAIPNAPELGTLTQFFFVARLCMLAEELMYNRTNANFGMYIVRENRPGLSDVPFGGPFAGVLAGGNTMQYMNGNTFEDIVGFSRYRTIIIRFGHFNPPGGVAGDPDDPPDAYDAETGYVKPVCGELTLAPTSPKGNQVSTDISTTGISTGAGAPGLEIDPHSYNIGGGMAGNRVMGITEFYYEFLEQYMVQDPFFDELATCMLKSILPYDHDSSCVDIRFTRHSTDPIAPFPESRWSNENVVKKNMNFYNNSIKAVMTGLWMQPNEPAGEDFFLIPSSSGAYLPRGVWTGADGPAGVLAGLNIPNIPPTFNNFVTQMRLKYEFNLPPAIDRLGWAGAALWYNEIANVNGQFMSAVQNLPKPTKYPLIMEEIANQHKMVDTNPSFKNRFNPLLQNGRLATLPRPGDQYIAAALYSGFMMWGRDSVQTSTHTRQTGNSFMDVVNMIFGTEGLYNLLEGMQIGDAPDGRTLNVHPLAALSSMGKGILDASLRNLMIGLVGQGIGEIFGDDIIGPAGKLIGDIAGRFALIGVSIGFVLYYVLPLLPFIYFFFGFSGWVKSIFEAMVAMPLWALAHIKIDGEGLPGPWATNGYFLLFEIFLRPTLMIFGLIASIILFTALVNGLNDTFHLVVLNATGYDIEANLYMQTAQLPNSNPTGVENTIDYIRGPLDEFMFTVMYAIIVYMLALASFKMIDQVPNHILRWIGATVSTFQERAGDPAGELTGKVYRAGEITRAQLMEMVGSLRGWRGMTVAETDIALGGASSGPKPR